MNWNQDRIQKILDETVGRQEVAGVSVLLCQGGTEAGYAASGYADIGSRTPIRRNTIFRMYSMTKPLIGFAAMRLWEEGRIDLLSPVSMYLPEYQFLTAGDRREPVVRQLNLHQLLSMTSGLTYGGTGCVNETETQKLLDDLEDAAESTAQVSTREVARRLAAVPLKFCPGTHWQYGMSADVLGAVLEQAADMPLRELMQKEVFVPLGMQDTDFYVPAEKQERLASAYTKKQNRLEKYTDNHLGIANHMREIPAFCSGGAGLVSTMDDYRNFAGMLLNHGVFNGYQLLKESTLRYFTGTVQTAPLAAEMPAVFDWMCGYNYGNLMRCCTGPQEAAMLSNKGEYGWDGWLGSVFINDPATVTTLLLMMQQTDAGFNECARRVKNFIWRS